MPIYPGGYHVYIDSEFVDGNLVIGHTELDGKEKKKVFISSYLCHPSMANNELSGPLVMAMLYQRICKWQKRRFQYQFIVNPETIGSISYLSRFGETLKEEMYAGLVLTCLGGDESLRYKASRRGDSPLDVLLLHLKEQGEDIRFEEFTPLGGSDERQYCSPGFNLPVGQMARKVYGSYPEYHTSFDTKELMGIKNIMDSCDKLERLFLGLELDGYYVNQYPYGEIKLGDYDLYPTINDRKIRDEKSQICDTRDFTDQVLMILNYSDGRHRMSEIAGKLGKTIFEVQDAVEVLLEKGLLKGPFSEEELL